MSGVINVWCGECLVWSMSGVVNVLFCTRCDQCLCDQYRTILYFSNYKMYFSKWKNAFVQMTKCILPNDNMYLTKWKNNLSNWQSVFVQMTKSIFPNDFLCNKPLYFEFTLYSAYTAPYLPLCEHSQFSCLILSKHLLSFRFACNLFHHFLYFANPNVSSIGSFYPFPSEDQIQPTPIYISKAKTHWGRAGWIPGRTGNGAGGRTVQVSYTCTAPGIKNI